MNFREMDDRPFGAILFGPPLPISFEDDSRNFWAILLRFVLGIMGRDFDAIEFDWPER